MKAKLNFRSVVFKRAYIIVKQTGCSFSSALVEAWKRYREFKARTVAELTNKIKDFDTSYQMCDDGRVYRYWTRIQIQIKDELSNLPGSFINSISSQISNTNKIQLFI